MQTKQPTAPVATVIQIGPFIERRRERQQDRARFSQLSTPWYDPYPDGIDGLWTEPISQVPAKVVHLVPHRNCMAVEVHPALARHSPNHL